MITALLRYVRQTPRGQLCHISPVHLIHIRLQIGGNGFKHSQLDWQALLMLCSPLWMLEADGQS
jgi:hypothetical protein